MLRGHAIRQLFGDLIRKSFYQDLHFYDYKITGYVADLLVEFLHTDQLYKIRNGPGKQLNDVGEMLLESNSLFEASSFDREREVRKHIGDYVLFLTGLFLAYLPRRRRSRSLDSVLDYVKAGKESYGIVAKFDQFEYRDAAPLFGRLSEHFELCVFGLNRVGGSLREMESRPLEQAERVLIT